MRGKILFISSVTLLFLTTPHPAYADVSAQLKQAETYQNNRQYEQAEAIYQQIATAFPDTNDALEAQMQLTLIYIATDRQQQADAAFEKLTAGFSKQKGIAEAVWQIGQRYIELKKYDKAYEINQYNVRHFPKDMYTMWSQVEIIYSHLREGDDVGADAAVEKLFTNFNDNPLIAGAVWDTGQYYRDLKKYDQANRLYKHVVENWPKDEHALWAQADLIKSYLAQGNDTAAEAAVDKLLSDFNDNQLVARAIWDTAQNYRGLKKYENANELYQHIVKTWPKAEHAVWAQADLIKSYLALADDPNAEAAVNKLIADFSWSEYAAQAIQDTAWEYRASGNYGRANELDQYVIEHWPGSTGEMWAKMGMAKTDIGLGNDAAAEKTIDILITDFNDNPELPTAIFQIGEEYYYKAMADVSAGRIDQADANFVKTVSIWDRIIIQFPDSNSAVTQDAYYFAGYCYGQLGEYEKAIQFWQKIVDAWPDYRYAWHAHFRIAHGYCMLGNSSIIIEAEANSRIEQAYKAVVENYPDCPATNDALVRLGNINYRGGQLTDAAKYYELFLEKFPRDKRWKDVLYILSYTYRKMGQSQLADELHKAFIEAGGLESDVSKRLEGWLENPEGSGK